MPSHRPSRLTASARDRTSDARPTMAHAHSHDAHSHPARSEHAHAPHPEHARAFAVGVVLNFALVVAEVIYGFAAHSMALLADAGHNLGDVLGLLLAGGAAPGSRSAWSCRAS